jgi:hypothetical protein
MEGYCFKCRAKREISNAKVTNVARLHAPSFPAYIWDMVPAQWRCRIPPGTESRTYILGDG